MSRWVIAACFSVLWGATAVAGATAPTLGNPGIVEALGSATARAKADFIEVDGQVVGEGATQMAAAKALSDKKDTVEAGLRRLAGATGIDVATGELKFEEVRPEGCASNSGDDKPMLSTGKCASIGVIATLDIKVTVAPAASVGQAAALAVQLGMTGVSLGEPGASDQAALEKQAINEAFQNARAQAELLAAASGGRLGAIVKINRGVTEEFGPPVVSAAKAAMLVRPAAEPPLTPEIALKLTAPDVQSSAWVAVVFALDPRP